LSGGGLGLHVLILRTSVTSLVGCLNLDDVIIPGECGASIRISPACNLVHNVSLFAFPSSFFPLLITFFFLLHKEILFLACMKNRLYNPDAFRQFFLTQAYIFSSEADSLIV
jgi:hypothetical protein